MSSPASTSSQANLAIGKYSGEQVPSTAAGRPSYPSPHGGAGGNGTANVYPPYNSSNGNFGSGEDLPRTLPRQSGGQSHAPLSSGNGGAVAVASVKQHHEGYYAERVDAASVRGSGAAGQLPAAGSSGPLSPPPPPPPPLSDPYAAAPVHASGAPPLRQPLPETTLRGPGRGPASGSNASSDAALLGVPAAGGGGPGHGSSPPPYPTNQNSNSAAANGATSNASSREPISGHHGSPTRVTAASRASHHSTPAAGSAAPAGTPPPPPRRYVDPTVPSAQGSSHLPSPLRPQEQRAPPPPPPPPPVEAAPPALRQIPAASSAPWGGAAWQQQDAAPERSRPPLQAREGPPAPAPAPAAALNFPSGAPRTNDPPAAGPASQSQRSGRPPASSSSAAAPVPPPPPPLPPSAEAPDAAFARPAMALSARLMALYKVINARYCNQRRLATPGPKYNKGYDDKEGHYIVFPGEEILGRYTVQEVLGKGSFGTVLRCYDEKRREAVALKITRHGSNFRSQAKLELDILLKLNENPNLNHLVVRLLKVFDWQGHLVLVFELLSFNLYQLIKCTRYNGVSLELVRKFAYQLVCTLLQLEQQKPQPIIHCDIKPENILLRNQNRSGIRLIDFGSACYRDKCVHKYIQSRFYRCPEVILYLGYTTAIDRWSLGCVLVELHTGMPLFDGRTEAAQLARFEATLGPVPADMISASCKAHKFYNMLPDGRFQLREPPLPRRSLESVIGVTTGGPRGSRRGTQGHDVASYWEFLDFITQLLRYHAHERISCQDALRHPFLAPLYLSDQQQRHARRQQQQQQQQQVEQQQQQQQMQEQQPPS